MIDWLEAIYRQAFPHLTSIIANSDVETQKKGVDSYLVLKNGHRVKVEEKERKKDYGDLLLEDFSNFERRSAGWARDDRKITDYLAYIIVPPRFAYILYYPALRRIFIDNLDLWRQKHSYVFGKTFEGDILLYTTANIPVPFNEFPEDWLAKNCWRYNA